MSLYIPQCSQSSVTSQTPCTFSTSILLPRWYPAQSHLEFHLLLIFSWSKLSWEKTRYSTAEKALWSIKMIHSSLEGKQLVMIDLYLSSLCWDREWWSLATEKISLSWPQGDRHPSLVAYSFQIRLDISELLVLEARTFFISCVRLQRKMSMLLFDLKEKW